VGELPDYPVLPLVSYWKVRYNAKDKTLFGGIKVVKIVSAEEKTAYILGEANSTVPEIAIVDSEGQEVGKQVTKSKAPPKKPVKKKIVKKAAKNNDSSIEEMEEKMEDETEVKENVIPEPAFRVSMSGEFGTIQSYFHDVVIQDSWLLLIKASNYRGSSYQPPTSQPGKSPVILQVKTYKENGELAFEGKVASLGINLNLPNYGMDLQIFGIVSA
jgi:hypothetical protein